MEKDVRLRARYPSLREAYRQDLREVKAATGFEYVRFHAIFHDEIGLYDEDEHGNPVHNYSYVDQIYDGLPANGVRPFVELSFMPKKLASIPTSHPFWYKPHPSYYPSRKDFAFAGRGRAFVKSRTRQNWRSEVRSSQSAHSTGCLAR